MYYSYMPSNNMLTSDDKKFILMAINDSMVELAGTTADLIDGVTVKIEEVRSYLNEVKKDVSILKQQAVQTNEGLTVIRQDLVSLHRRIDFLERGRAGMINDADYDPDSRM